MEINGQVIVLILFVVISGIQWLIKKIQGQKEAPHEIPESLEEIYDSFREEIRQRQTTIQEPSPPPLPEVVQEPITELPHPQIISFEQPQTPSFTGHTTEELTAAQKEAAERFSQLGKKRTRKSKTAASVSARALLSSPQSARQAIILQEIFGKPRSLQKF